MEAKGKVASTIRIYPDQLLELKKIALDRGTTLSDLCFEIFSEFLKKEKKKAGDKR